MKLKSLIFWAMLVTITLNAQDISGTWNGVLKVRGISLRLVLHVDSGEEGYGGTLDSPDQGAEGIPISAMDFQAPSLSFAIEQLGIAYQGEWKDGEIIEGTFTQMGQSFPLALSREAIEAPKRPQEPTPPYPYTSEEVTFPNTADDIALSGTLTLPRDAANPPAVVLISGSGPQDRNEEVFGHKPFLVLSDHLTRNGIAVLRYDDRGTGKSTGVHQTATSEDLARDVSSAVAFLKGRNDIDIEKIGLIGHSEGGMLAPMVAADSKEIAYMVLLAGPGISGYDILMLQTELIQKANGVSGPELDQAMKDLAGALAIIRDTEDASLLKERLTAYLTAALEARPEQIPEGMEPREAVTSQVNALATPWMHYFISYDPAQALRGVQCPVLALNGQMDLQVPAEENLAAIEKYLKEGGNTSVTTHKLPGLNHLFQESATGAPSEYSTLEETFSPMALEEITQWILIQTE
jgi:pimeloyl-ACP methyl ester carboxylesterase